MHRITRSRAALLAWFGVLVFSIAACSSSSPKANPSTTTARQGGPVAANSSDSASGGSGGATCTQITVADVQPLVAHPITKSAARPAGLDGKGQNCFFNTADNDGAISITVIRGKEAADTYAHDVQGFKKAMSVAGIGDKASRDAGDDSAGVVSLKGNTYCSVDAIGEEIPGVAQLQDAAGNTNNIGDPAYAVIDSAIGTLCNRIFGSGNTTPDMSALPSTPTPTTSS